MPYDYDNQGNPFWFPRAGSTSSDSGGCSSGITVFIILVTAVCVGGFLLLNNIGAISSKPDWSLSHFCEEYITLSRRVSRSGQSQRPRRSQRRPQPRSACGYHPPGSWTSA